MKTPTFLTILLSLFIMNNSFTNPIQKDLLVAKNGAEITVHFIQHASLYFTFEGMNIYADPVSYEGIDYKTLPKADLILITHDHYDHLDKNAIADISKSNTKIYCNSTVYHAIEKGTVLENGDEITYQYVSNNYTHKQHVDIKIEAVPAYNTTEGRDVFHPKGRDNGYVITLGGTRIYIPGDCENMPEMKDLKDIDIVFLPVNQPYTMTVIQAIHAAKIIKPKILYPIHYSDTDLEGLAVLKNDGIEVRIFKM